MDIRHSSFFFKNFKMTAVIIPEFMVSHQSLNFGKKVKVKLSWRSLQPPNKSGIKGCHTSLGELVITALGSWEQPGWLLGSPVAPLRPPMKAQPVPSKPPFNQKQSAALLVIHGNLQWRIDRTHWSQLVSFRSIGCLVFLFTHWKSFSVEATSIIPPLVQENAFQRALLRPAVCVKVLTCPAERRRGANKQRKCANDWPVNSFYALQAQRQYVYSLSDWSLGLFLSHRRNNNGLGNI